MLNQVLWHTGVNKLLEPNVGNGAIVKRVMQQSQKYLLNRVDMVELDPRHTPAIFDHLKTWQRQNRMVSFNHFPSVDFLKWHPGTDYNLIMMNPPFTKGLYIDHIRKAFDHLAVNGQLLAFCLTNYQFNQASKFKRFNEWLDDIEAERRMLPKNSFKVSGTTVDVELLNIVK